MNEDEKVGDGCVTNPSIKGVPERILLLVHDGTCTALTWQGVNTDNFIECTGTDLDNTEIEGLPEGDGIYSCMSHIVSVSYDTFYYGREYDEYLGVCECKIATGEQVRKWRDGEYVWEIPSDEDDDCSDQLESDGVGPLYKENVT